VHITAYEDVLNEYEDEAQQPLTVLVETAALGDRDVEIDRSIAAAIAQIEMSPAAGSPPIPRHALASGNAQSTSEIQSVTNGSKLATNLLSDPVSTSQGVLTAGFTDLVPTQNSWR
jgi:hypothetical protein